MKQCFLLSPEELADLKDARDAAIKRAEELSAALKVSRANAIREADDVQMLRAENEKLRGELAEASMIRLRRTWRHI